MTWRLAQSLEVLRNQVDASFPNRSKVNDGTIGDASHAASTSDHNPNSSNVVTAIDITHDPAHGFDAGHLAEILRLARDPRIKYVISNRRIFSSKVSPWVWRSYNGANAHSEHVHISVMPDAALWDDRTPWQTGFTPLPLPVPLPTPRPTLFTKISATEFGGVGDEQPSAYSDVKTDWPNRPGVALPFRFTGKRPMVRVYRGGAKVDCEIVDVGPWNIKDPYWTTGTRPQAETGIDMRGRRTNHAGIDLTPAAMDALLVPGPSGTRTVLVDWEFITEAAPQPLPLPSTLTFIETLRNLFKWIFSNFSRS
jgi:hypothetical protein